MESSSEGGDEGAGPASVSPAQGSSAPPAAGTVAGGSSGRLPAKRVMKTPYQLEVLERTYTEDPYPNETTRVELSVRLGLTDRQLQMWFCHRRLKDRKLPPGKRQQQEEEVAVTVMAPPPMLQPHSELAVGSVSAYGHQLLPGRGPGRSSAVSRISAPEVGRRFYEPQQVMLPPLAPVQLTRAAQRVIDSVEKLIGEPLREDGPILGLSFDPPPPGAFGAPIVQEQRKQPFRSHETNIFSGHDPKLMKASTFLPSIDPSVPSTVTGKRKFMAGNSSHLGSRAVHEYQFLPEQPSDIHERTSQARFYDASVEASNLRISSLATGSRLLGAEQASGYAYHVEGQLGIPQVAGFDNSLASSEGMDYQDEDAYRLDRKRKHNEESKIAKEVEAHEKRIRKELEKQDVLKKKREEQMQKEVERLDRERKKEEERFMREKQREEERLQKEQWRENKRMEKFLVKQSLRAEKQRQKEELRKEKEAARQKTANEKATARRIAREYMELMEDERLELMELVSRSKGLPSMLSLDSDTLQQLDSFRGVPYIPGSKLMY